MKRIISSLAVGMFFIIPSLSAEPLLAAVEGASWANIKAQMNIVDREPRLANKMTVSNRVAGTCERCVSIYWGQARFGLKEMHIFSITAEELLARDPAKYEELKSVFSYVDLDRDPMQVVFNRSYPAAEFFRMVFISPRGGTIDLSAPSDKIGRAGATFRIPPPVDVAQQHLLREFREFVAEIPQARGRLTFSYYYK